MNSLSLLENNQESRSLLDNGTSAALVVLSPISSLINFVPQQLQGHSPDMTILTTTTAPSQTTTMIPTRTKQQQ